MDVLLFFLAFFTALPVGMGIGGGGLLTLCLSLLGEGQLEAQGKNLCCFLVAGGISVALRLGNLRGKGKSLLWLSCGAMLGAIPGALLSGLLPQRLLRRLLGGFLLLCGIHGLYRTGKTKSDPTSPKKSKNTP